MGGSPLRCYMVCVGNSARSQMAQAFCETMGGEGVDCRSAGSDPLGSLRPEAVEVMEEKGIDLSGHASEGIDETFAREADVVVTMGCGEEACPVFANREVKQWNLVDPGDGDLKAFRKVRDEIEERVWTLLVGHGAL